MALLLPSSRGSFRVRVPMFDLFWAAAAPLLALHFGSAYILNAKGGAPLVLLYCAISLACSVIAFLVFRIGDSISRYFSVHDAFNVIKAVVASGLMTSLVLFTFTRLEGISALHSPSAVFNSRRRASCRAGGDDAIGSQR